MGRRSTRCWDILIPPCRFALQNRALVTSSTCAEELLLDKPGSVETPAARYAAWPAPGQSQTRGGACPASYHQQTERWWPNRSSSTSRGRSHGLERRVY